MSDSPSIRERITSLLPEALEMEAVQQGREEKTRLNTPI